MSKTDAKNKKDAVKEFEHIVSYYILPLIPTIGKLRRKDTIPSRKLKKLINVYSNNTLGIYPCLSNPQFHYSIDLEEESPSLGAAESILREIMYMSQYNYGKKNFPKILYYESKDLQVYRNSRFDTAYEVGLCKWLGGPSVYRLLDKLQNWSRKTYEGHRMAFSFIMDTTKKERGSNDYIHFLDSKHSAVFTDGMSCGITLDNNGHVIDYFSTPDNENTNVKILAPYRFSNFAQKCYKDRVGIILQSNGDILIFKTRKLVFAKCNGRWMHINEHRVYPKIAEHLSVDDALKNDIAKELYLSILDISFSHAGGCIGIVSDNNKDKVKNEYITRDDLDSDSRNEKKDMLRRLVGYNAGTGSIFHNLDRKLRRDLLSLDGATVIDSSGRIMCIGAIVRIDNEGSEEGARLAAAKQLAHFGLGIKISTDGRVQGFSKSVNKPVEEIFSLL